MIYELRIYETVPGKLPALHERFANHTLKFFEKYGIGIVGFWTEEIGENNKLIYLLKFDNLADRETRWSAFQQDPDWIKTRSETERDGPIVRRISNRIWKPTEYSPMK